MASHAQSEAKKKVVIETRTKYAALSEKVRLPLKEQLIFSEQTDVESNMAPNYFLKIASKLIKSLTTSVLLKTAGAKL
jgi:hypothetical protein